VAAGSWHAGFVVAQGPGKNTRVNVKPKEASQDLARGQTWSGVRIAILRPPAPAAQFQRISDVQPGMIIEHACVPMPAPLMQGSVAVFRRYPFYAVAVSHPLKMLTMMWFTPCCLVKLARTPWHEYPPALPR
jgi:hypothetical protein